MPIVAAGRHEEFGRAVPGIEATHDGTRRIVDLLSNDSG
jgi:hypothetical protein